MAIVNSELNSKLRSRLGYVAYEDIQDRIDNGQLDEYDVVIVKDQDTVAYIGPDLTVHNVTARIEAYMSEATAVRALNASSTTYVGMPLAVYYQGSYKLYVANGKPGNWEVLPAWGNPVNLSYNELVDVPIVNKEGTTDEVLILNQLSDGMYSVNGIFKITNDSSDTLYASSPELILVKDGGNIVMRVTGKDTISYDTTSGSEPIVDKVATESVVDQMIDTQFNERLEETSSQSIHDLFN